MYVAKLLRERVDATLAEHGGSFPMWLALVHVGQEPGISQRQLAERMTVEGPTLTHHLERFEADGLIDRTRSATDRRVVHVHLTPAGERKLAELREVMGDFDADLRGLFTPRQTAALERALQRLQHHLDPVAPDHP